MSSLKNVILISCGSFNPVTIMHLRIFEIARDYLRKLDYNVIGGIISPTHDCYKKEGLVSSTHRCEMVNQALKTSNWIRLSAWETQQEGWSTTIQCLTYHQKQLQELSTSDDSTKKARRDVLDWLNPKLQLPDSKSDGSMIRLLLLCGADLLETFATPGLWAEEDLNRIVGEHGLVVITREGSDPYKFVYESDVLYKFRNNIFIVPEWITNDISSTKVRRALRRGESVKYIVPDPVLSYIFQNKLYGSDQSSTATVNHSKFPCVRPFSTSSPIDMTMVTSNYPTWPSADMKHTYPNPQANFANQAGPVEMALNLKQTTHACHNHVGNAEPMPSGSNEPNGNGEPSNVQIHITKSGIKVISDKESIL